MTKDNKAEWLLLKVEGSNYTLTNDNERTIKEILLSEYQPYTVVLVYDFLTGAYVDELTVDDLFGEKTK